MPLSKILLVDADNDFRVQIARCFPDLEREGAILTAARQDAVRRAGADRPDVILLQAAAASGSARDFRSALSEQKATSRIPVIPVTADFARPFSLPAEIADLPKLGFFPGSTIGNFVPDTATDLLRNFREFLGVGSRLLIRMERVNPV